MKTSSLGARIVHKLARLRVADRLDLQRNLAASHLRRLFRRYDVDAVFDVGGNQGQFATMLRDEVGFDGLIVTFEPIPAAAALLRAKAARDSNWVIEELALSDREGEADFHITHTSEFSSLSMPRHDEVGRFVDNAAIEEVVRVRTELLSDALARMQGKHRFERPYLKLDTQGFDARIVAASADCMRTFIAMQSEISIKKLYEDSMDFRQALTLYERCGFEVSAFVPVDDQYFPQLIESDCILVRADLMPRRPLGPGAAPPP